MILGVLINFINLLIDGIAKIANIAFMLLPNSPFKDIDFGTIPYVKTLNWFIPIDFMVVTLVAWTTAIALFYVVMIVLRWAKAIQ